ncbi:6044_t:CDS:2 [Acaulospora morrowiae]|uniref:6044_t:CDS:1 n=1 Tax=Acaulospora morrowiae TaxID=94023 RepID=A0A9N9BIR7_9GLOM|nr:6044_t:CDS:2 [Acaulospora morrowiae]
MGKVQSKYNRNRSQSCTTPTRDHEYCGKRKYSISYALPLNNNEVDRLTSQHYIFNNIWGGDFSSPVHRLLECGGAKVLDVGCGPGVFVLEMANRYPMTSFTGVDIADAYPHFIKPENTSFKRANITGGLPFADNSFDFVYMRFMMFALVIKEWPFIINELARVCKPGGWIEVMERDIYWYNEGERTNKWRTKVVEGLRNEKGIELSICSHIPGFFKANEQLTNFSSDERIQPLGSWAGPIGKFSLQNEFFLISLKCKAYAQTIMWGAKNLSQAISTISFEEGEYEKLVEIAMEELDKNKAFDKSHRFWAMKKPL